MGPQLEAAAHRDANVKLRIVDIHHWGSPVARQHGIRSLPTVWLYEDGHLTSRDTGEILRRLQPKR